MGACAPAVAPVFAPPDGLRRTVVRAMESIHDSITSLFMEMDEGGAFEEHSWERDGGGGGVARLLTEGTTFEKVGANRSVVFGSLPPAAVARLMGQEAPDEPAGFFATGVSLVAHPRSPMIPTVHLNVRYFELLDEQGAVRDRWFGGGTDLTPTYPDPDDARHFHRALRDVCDRHHASFHPRFKAWCDRYFVNAHRDGEARGVGGIFFDHLRPSGDASALDAQGLLAFVRDIGTVLSSTYRPIVTRRRHTPWGDVERACQAWRRGRYVEFNLVHDRGTLFGLQTSARTESVLMSLPPLAAWQAPTDAEAALQRELLAMLAPRDWTT